MLPEPVTFRGSVTRHAGPIRIASRQNTHRWIDRHPCEHVNEWLRCDSDATLAGQDSCRCPRHDPQWFRRSIPHDVTTVCAHEAQQS